MKITINGTVHELPEGISLPELLRTLNLAQPHLAVAINQEVIPRGELGQRRLQAGDQVELVHPVGGG